MNHAYRIVKNAATGLWQAVSETARANGKCGGGITQCLQTHFCTPSGAAEKQRPAPSRWPLTRLAAALFLFSSPLSLLHAAPTGGQISAGSGSIAQSGATTTITQATPKLAINWHSFSTLPHEAVRFQQPSASAIALNRITGPEQSQLLGSLTANGQVFILNPNGVLFGKDAQVNVGGLVASTKNLSDNDFLQGNYRFTGESTAAIKNLGHIQALPGGYVALIADTIDQQGRITTPQGRTELAAEQQLTLRFADQRLVSLSVDQGALQSQIDSGGVILAEGGIVHLTAKGLNELSKAVINHTGLIEATRSALNDQGEVVLLADMKTGTTKLQGEIKAEGKNGADGGFI